MPFNVIDIFLHLDKYLQGIIQTYQHWTYLLLFLVIFCETGLVVTPFLPGDSLIFAAGAFAAAGSFNVFLLWAMLCGASILGDNVNYWVGKLVGEKIKRFLKPEHLERTHLFFEKHGGKAIIMGKYFPIIRTFVPFVAGLSRMTYPRFLTFNVIGGITWISIFVWGGYFFGNLPVVRHNFTMVIFGIIGISLIPAAVEFFKHTMAAKAAAPSPTNGAGEN